MASLLPWRRRPALPDPEVELAPPEPPAPPSIGDECDAYVTGRYAEYAAAHGWPVPVWAWINALAHADDARVRRVEAEGLPGVAAEDPLWQGSMRRLARATRAEARRRWGLPYVQAAVLRPLEAVLIDDHRYDDLAANDFTALVLALIHGHPSARL
jgi:hypothetical protein